MLWPVRTLLVATASLAATAVFAQDTNYRSIEATADKPVQVPQSPPAGPAGGEKL